MASVTTTEVDRGLARARSGTNALLEAAMAGWATTFRLAFLLVLRCVGWVWIAYLAYRSGGLDALV